MEFLEVSRPFLSESNVKVGFGIRDLPFRDVFLEGYRGPLLAGSTSYPTSGLWKRTSEIRHLTLRPLWSNPWGGYGSRRDRRPFGFIAGKRSVRFRFPKTASRH
jgi:hypothetical protein